MLTAALAKLFPEEAALATFNSQYLQRHSTSAKAILASARVLRIIGSPAEEIDNTVFSVFNPEVDLNVTVSPNNNEHRCIDSEFLISGCARRAVVHARIEIKQSGRIQTSLRLKIPAIHGLQDFRGDSKPSEGRDRFATRATSDKRYRHRRY